jgi:hypothetical protein
MSNNKKQDFSKPPYELLPQLALAGASRGLQHGDAKYGTGNYMEAPRSADTVKLYVAAIYRHLAEIQGADGKWEGIHSKSEDSGIPHIHHAMADMMILAAIFGIGDPGQSKLLASMPNTATAENGGEAMAFIRVGDLFFKGWSDDAHFRQLYTWERARKYNSTIDACLDLDAMSKEERAQLAAAAGKVSVGTIDPVTKKFNALPFDYYNEPGVEGWVLVERATPSGSWVVKVGGEFLVAGDWLGSLRDAGSFFSIQAAREAIGRLCKETKRLFDIRILARETP